MIGLVTHAGAIFMDKKKMTPDFVELRVSWSILTLRVNGVDKVCYHPRHLFLHVYHHGAHGD